MKYLNTEERGKKKKKFILYYIITIAVIVLGATAFYVPPKVITEQVTREIKEQQIPDKPGGATGITLLNEQWLRLQQRRAEYNAMKSKGATDAEMNRLKQAYNTKEGYVRKILDSLSKPEALPNSELSRLTVLYNNILSIPQIEENTTSKVGAVNNSNDKEQLSMLQSQLQTKDEQIEQLQKDISDAKKERLNALGKTTNNSGDAKFLNWALSSQTAAVAKLKTENAKLKTQLNDLKKYLQ